MKKAVNNNGIVSKRSVICNSSSNDNVTESSISFKSYLIVAVVGILFYANTIVNEYALDDSIVITYNRFTQAGFSGIGDIFMYDSFKGFDDSFVNSVSGGRYRPLSLATFAIENQLWGNNPHISHLINVLLFTISCLMLYSILVLLFENRFKAKKWYLSVPLLTTVIFAAHPIHTEVVANIKSRDEIMALLFSFITLWMIIKYFKTNKILYIVFSPIIFLLALLSKEISIVFVALIPISIYYFIPSKFKQIVKISIPLIVTSVFFVVVRQLILFNTELNANALHDVSNYSFAEMNLWQKYATITYSLGLYLKLLFIPHPLTWDYYPYHIEIKEWNNAGVILSLIVYCVLLYKAISGIKNKTFMSYAILIFLIPLSLTSNILFPVGAFMCERFLYISSIGFALIVSYILVDKSKLGKYKAFSNPLWVLLPVLSLYALKTIDRNSDWKNDETLVSTDVKTSKNSLKSTSEYGNILFYKAEKTINESERKQYYESALEYEEKAFNICKNLAIPNFVLGTIYGKYKNDLTKAAYYLNNVVNLDPKNVDAYNNLGIIYCMTNKYQAAINIFERGLKISHNDVKILGNLSQLYSIIGQQTKAAYYHNRLKELQHKNQSLSVTE